MQDNGSMWRKRNLKIEPKLHTFLAWLSCPWGNMFVIFSHSLRKRLWRFSRLLAIGNDIKYSKFPQPFTSKCIKFWKQDLSEGWPLHILSMWIEDNTILSNLETITCKVTQLVSWKFKELTWLLQTTFLF
jgi:hypothetical protein